MILIAVLSGDVYTWGIDEAYIEISNFHGTIRCYLMMKSLTQSHGARAPTTTMTGNGAASDFFQ
jgi:uncharacterized membrane protein YoaK (UPF0700 family)